MPRYEIDAGRSRVWIEARSSVHPIHSESDGLEGWVELGDVPKAAISLALARMTSGNPLNDREMRRRVDARRYPTIDGELTRLRELGDGRFAAHGRLTFHGVTKDVAGELTVSAVDEHTVSIEGEQTFDIRDFGVDPPKILVLRVYPDVKVRIRVVARQAG